MKNRPVRFYYNKNKSLVVCNVERESLLFGEIREIGAKLNKNNGDLVVGATYPSRIDKTLKKIEAWEQEFKKSHPEDKIPIETKEGTYGGFIRVVRVAEIGFILIFPYNKEFISKLKNDVPGAIYVPLTKTWHVPSDSWRELDAALNSL